MSDQEKGEAKRTVPRAPGMRFPDIVRQYTKHPVPDYLLIDNSEWLGDEDIPVDRYITREEHDLEKERIWKKVWQVACREERVPEVGDAIVYEITDISIIVVRVSPTEIKAYYNVCLHQGRALREYGVISHNRELRCPFHGFCWRLDGKIEHIPSQWDFPQIDKSKFGLREVRVGRWGGFVFINMDPHGESLESFMGDMPKYWYKYPLEERYIAAHVTKVFPANWKTAQEAFMEGFHARMTHPQFLNYTGKWLDSEQYDAFENYSRGLGMGSAEISAAYTPTAEERLASFIPVPGPPEFAARVREHGPIEDVEVQMQQHLHLKREVLRQYIGSKVDSLSDFEVSGGGYFTLFPNFHPWWAYDEIIYLFRPYKDEPEMSVMEVYLLHPFQGERPQPAPTRRLDVHESFLDAPELGPSAQVFHQDEFNIPAVQIGLHNLKAIGKGITLGTYHGTKIRHFHKLWDKWIHGKPVVRGG
jgi:phenylpropionate dioxygenase-like ring-hydroxylating dioxygenase large terminal subunit